MDSRPDATPDQDTCLVDEVKTLIGMPDTRLREIIDATPSCHKIIDKNGALLSMNQRGLELIDADELESVLMSDVYSLVEPDFRDTFKAFNERVCNGATESLVFKLTSLKGVHRWMESWAAPYKLANGETAHIAITNDVTERVESEVTLEQQRHALEVSSRLAAIGELAAGLAHEINNPLCIIQGIADKLRMQLESGDIDLEKSLRDIEHIEQTVERISLITTGLRTFSRDEPAENREQTHLLSLIKDAISFTHERLRNEGIAVTIEGEKSLSANVNSVQICQVLLNLLANAIYAIKGSEAPWIHISVKQTDNWVRISFADCGVIKDPVVLEKMMSPFYTTKLVGEGTGLGLSISLGIIAAHHGRLYFDRSAPTTTFQIELPV